MNGMVRRGCVVVNWDHTRWTRQREFCVKLCGEEDFGWKGSFSVVTDAHKGI